jgi:hypothetical protein
MIKIRNCSGATHFVSADVAKINEAKVRCTSQAEQLQRFKELRELGELEGTERTL